MLVQSALLATHCSSLHLTGLASVHPFVRRVLSAICWQSSSFLLHNPYLEHLTVSPLQPSPFLQPPPSSIHSPFSHLKGLSFGHPSVVNGHFCEVILQLPSGHLIKGGGHLNVGAQYSGFFTFFPFAQKNNPILSSFETREDSEEIELGISVHAKGEEVHSPSEHLNGVEEGQRKGGQVWPTGRHFPFAQCFGVLAGHEFWREH